MRQHDGSVVILHDRIPYIGGAETVLFEAARILDAPIYTTYVASDVAIPNDIDIRKTRQEKYMEGAFSKVVTSNGHLSNQIEYLNLMLDLTDPDRAVRNFNVVVQSGAFSKHFVPGEEQTVIHYTHSPPRWMFDLYHDILREFPYPGLQTALKFYLKAWRVFDKEATGYIDEFIANSDVIANRVDRYYSRDSKIVYPPVTGDWRNEGDDGYFITWSRLAPEKRVALIGRAFETLDERLVIAGEGPEHNKVQAIADANENIEFKGRVDDIESLVARATAVIYAPVKEDFGLVGAEALSAGKPLLGVNEGFTTYQITPETGELFSPTVASLRKTIREFNPESYRSEQIKEYAQRYQREQFEKNLLDIVQPQT